MAIESPLFIIFQMIATVLGSFFNTILTLVSLSGGLGDSLGFISGFGGLGLVLSVIIFAAVMFFVFKFVLKSAKMIIVLFIVGVIILFIMFSAA